MLDAIIWTDGSCSHQGHGGWAALVCRWLPNDYIIRDELTGYDYPVTNNQMEMQAAIEGLKHLAEPHHVYLVSDSAYLLNTLKHGWTERWIKERALHPDLPLRPNWHLWMTLEPLVQFHQMEYIKVRGHKSKEEGGDPYNERVDRLAVEARKIGQEIQTQRVGVSDG